MNELAISDPSNLMNVCQPPPFCSLRPLSVASFLPELPSSFPLRRLRTFLSSLLPLKGEACYYYPGPGKGLSGFVIQGTHEILREK